MIRLVIAALTLAVTALAPDAQAQFAWRHSELTRAISKLEAVEGRPQNSQDAYLALRLIWGTYNHTNPAFVEEALLTAASAPRLTPPVRAYAGLLSAYAMLRRGDLAAAAEKISSLGYVDRWLIVGPFDNEGKAGLDQEFEPELQFDQPIVPGRAYSGKEHSVGWRQVPHEFSYGYLNTGALIRPQSHACVFLTTFVSSKSKQRRQISAWVGAAGAFHLYFNGRKVLSDQAYRGHDADRLSARLTLEPGVNNLTLKLCGDEQAPVVSLRLANADGSPDASLEYTNELSASQAAAELIGKRAPPVDSTQTTGDGPLQRYQALAERENPDPAQLERFARYLSVTFGDDPSQHLARDLAHRAAELEPTIDRLLLAGELAEDRNKRALYLEKARALPASQASQNIDFLLALAQHKSTGPNWREASRYFDQVLALDPDRIEAIQGRVELYNEAGLPRTALQTLKRALDRNPYSVGLLNMYASQLRNLGRLSAAQAVESRYSALRFDDKRFLHEIIELGTQRNDRAATVRWIERLLKVDPDSAWAHGVAARSYRALGEPERALSSYEAALEFAPEDVGTLRDYSDLLGELGRRDEQLRVLERILKVRHQERLVREYVEHIRPPKTRPDESYAWEASRFLPFRHAPANGHDRRTLRDLTVNTVFENGLKSTFRQVVFQPLTSAAAAMARQYVFYYRGDTQQVQLRGAKVYRTDGRVDEAIEYGEAAANDPTISMYTSGRNFHVQFPRLEAGDVVELRYRVDDVTPRNEFADYFGEVAYLQSVEPVQNAEYVLIAPKSRTLYIDPQLPGLERTVKTQSDRKIYRFFAEHIPGINPEPNMPPLPEVLGFVHVSTYKSWQQLGRWYWGLSREQFDLDEETRQLAARITDGAETDLEKVRAVFNWVVKNTRYVALEFGIYGYKPRRCVQTVARGWGDCKDKATVIVTLLEQLGIDATIVIVRSQLKGRFKSTVPSLALFDHAIAYVPSLDLYLDGTAEYAGADELPKMDLGAIGLRIHEGNAELVRLPEADPEKNVVSRELTAHLNTDGSASMELHYETRGVSAPDWRRRYQAEATRLERLTQDLGREFGQFSIDDGRSAIKTNDLKNFDEPVRIDVRGKSSNFARREGARLSLSVTPNVGLTSSFASLSQRQQDLRILAFDTRDERIVVHLPAGMKVIEAPKNVEKKTPFGEYSVKVVGSAGKVTVTSRILLSVSRVPPKQYPAFKRFCEEVDHALGQRLVVSR